MGDVAVAIRSGKGWRMPAQILFRQDETDSGAVVSESFRKETTYEALACRSLLPRSLLTPPSGSA